MNSLMNNLQSRKINFTVKFDIALHKKKYTEFRNKI